MTENKVKDSLENRLQNFIEKNGVKYYVTIGLEVHAEMSTQSKMWCNCKNESLTLKANTNICPICMAHPGTLPVPNKKAIQNVIKVGLAMNANIADFTEFDRKNYFYPDIPKGYQISQYKYPIVSEGSLSGIDITRIHLEEDTAKSTHDISDNTLVDFNRAGVPLMELVTEPVIYDAKMAVNFAKELQLLLRYLKVSDADMEKGQMRVEVNISVSTSPDKFNTKVEVKNINSFKAVEKSIDTEIARHVKAMEDGMEIVQETRGYDESTGGTISQRKKENSADYRYFPDPDITKFYLHSHPDFNPEKLKLELPELPNQKRQRLADLNIKSDYIELFVTQTIFGGYLDKILLEMKGSNAIMEYKDVEAEKINLITNYICSDLISIFNKDENFSFPSPLYLIELITFIQKGEISSKSAKEILNILVLNAKNGKEVSANEIAHANNLFQITNESELANSVKTIIEDPKNIKSIEDYKSGKEQALMALVGQVIKDTNGRANPNVTKNIFIKLLS